MNIRHAFCLAGVAVAGCLTACHRTAAYGKREASLCASQAVVEAQTSGRVRIDGPGAWGPRLDDSVVLVVDGEERWRGVYAGCQPPALTGAMHVSLPQPADSVESIRVIWGDSVRMLFGIGGKWPSAVLIRTRRVP